MLHLESVSRLARSLTPVVLVSPSHYRVVYRVRQAHLHLGRPISPDMRHCTALVAPNDGAVLLVDLFEYHRGQPGFLGLQVLRISRRLPAKKPAASPVV